MPNNVGSQWTVMKIATPSGSPPSGQIFMYVKGDNNLYGKSSAGVEYLIGPSGGSSPTITYSPKLLSSDFTLPASMSAIISGSFEIGDRTTLELAAQSSFEIT